MKPEAEKTTTKSVNELLIVVGAIMLIFVVGVTVMINFTGKLITMEYDIYESADDITRIQVLQSKYYSELIDIIMEPGVFDIDDLTLYRDALVNGDLSSAREILYEAVDSSNMETDVKERITETLNSLKDIGQELSDVMTNHSLRVQRYEDYTMKSMNLFIIRIINYKILDVEDTVILSIIEDEPRIYYHYDE